VLGLTGLLLLILSFLGSSNLKNLAEAERLWSAGKKGEAFEYFDRVDLDLIDGKKVEAIMQRLIDHAASTGQEERMKKLIRKAVKKKPLLVFVWVICRGAAGSVRSSRSTGRPCQSTRRPSGIQTHVSRSFAGAC